MTNEQIAEAEIWVERWRGRYGGLSLLEMRAAIDGICPAVAEVKRLRAALALGEFRGPLGFCRVCGHNDTGHEPGCIIGELEAEK